jgi:hypothetical protein
MSSQYKATTLFDKANILTLYDKTKEPSKLLLGLLSTRTNQAH